jgi:hypothetical protein
VRLRIGRQLLLARLQAHATAALARLKLAGGTPG